MTLIIDILLPPSPLLSETSLFGRRWRWRGKPEGGEGRSTGETATVDVPGRGAAGTTEAGACHAGPDPAARSPSAGQGEGGGSPGGGGRSRSQAEGSEGGGRGACSREKDERRA